jgi:hypothetical protein
MANAQRKIWRTVLLEWMDEYSLEGGLFFGVMSDAHFFGGEQCCIGNKATDAPAFKFCGFIDLLAFLVREVHESFSAETRLRPPAGSS